MKHRIVLILLLLCPFMRAGDIDKIIDRFYTENKIHPSTICSDEVFLRRVYVILTGRIPDEICTRQFLESKDKEKRSALINRLLSSDEYVEFQVMKWGDLLRIKSEFPSNLWPNAVQAYNRILKQQIRDSVPYNQMVSNILSSSGSNFRDPGVNFYRAFQKRTPEGIYSNISLLFLGDRNPSPEGKCFFEQLTYKKTDEWKEEIVAVDIDKRPSLRRIPMMDGSFVVLTPGTDFRKPFIAWLTAKENKRFADVMANRVWFWLMGQGIVQEPDDFRSDNPPVIPSLLDYLSQYLVNHNYDIRALSRIILNSDAFQRSSLSSGDNRQSLKYFAYYPTTRLTSEVLCDAVNDIAGVSDKYVSKVPEPYSYFPPDTRAVTLGDGTVSSSKLEMFGRPSRDFSYENERNNNLTQKQIIFLLNSTQISDKFKNSPYLKSVLSTNPSLPSITDTLYLRILNRFPSTAERETAMQFQKTFENKRDYAQYLCWALINTKEFIFNH